jgi:hypothetical protein
VVTWLALTRAVLASAADRWVPSVRIVSQYWPAAASQPLLTCLFSVAG